MIVVPVCCLCPDDALNISVRLILSTAALSNIYFHDFHGCHSKLGSPVRKLSYFIMLLEPWREAGACSGRLAGLIGHQVDNLGTSAIKVLGKIGCLLGGFNSS